MFIASNAAVLLLLMLLLSVQMLVSSASADEVQVCTVDEEATKVVKPLRDFTVEQLGAFVGEDCKEIYVSHNNFVFDVTSRRADLEASDQKDFILGKNITELMNTNSKVREVMQGVLFDVFGQLNENVQVVGLLSAPLPFRRYSLVEMRALSGAERVTELADLDTGSPGNTVLAALANKERLDSPILLALMGRVFDVSYGAAHLYGPGNHYSYFAGHDVSRAMVFYTESIDDSDPITIDKVHGFVAEIQRLDAESTAAEVSSGTPRRAGASDTPKMDSLESWLKVYTVNRRYPVVGELVH